MLLKPVNHEQPTNTSKSPSTKNRNGSLSRVAKRLNLRIRPEELQVEQIPDIQQEAYGKGDYLLTESSYNTQYEHPLEKQPAVYMKDHGTQDRRQNNRYSTGSEIYGLPEVSKHSTYKPVSRSPIRDKSKEEAGASFKIGLGGHNLSGGIHLSKNKTLKRSSKNESSNSLPSKYSKNDPLAYGNFSVDHLAYPDPPKSRSHVDVPRRETSRVRPTSVTYDSPSASIKKPEFLPSNQRNDATISPLELSQNMHSLQVNDKQHIGIGAGTSISSAPGSPLLESYRGTYQSISPMPSPLLKAMHHITSANTDINFHYSSADERSNCSNSRDFRRTARFHDPEEEAKLLARALRGERRLPDTMPLISILPGLTHIQILELRFQYKKIVRTGKGKKGVNLAKHIKLRLKSQPDLMKACYVCALGQWESEAYWANYWYQSQKSQRELLIESLMGRTNEEIRSIKEGFRDKKYHNNLTRCLQTELREDKFKKAVMLVLEEKQMEESPDGSVDKDLVASDVIELRNAVKEKRGGETAVIKIVLLRSKTHLRELLKAYNLMYEKNFAKEILQKSENLVGELLAHILNGIINAPYRDALLLHHALTLPRIDNSWCDLLISRLVRYHWDRPHFERIRSEFRHLYNTELQTAIIEGVSGDLGLFLEALCVRRTESDVRVLPPT
ncbi:putative annexin anxc4 [Erysiphe neolycopersici]|uniref:Putative annexin anxc4 n=1 Tax=Erysiphe neolycopersici TaxID=212602 RepID=A0A420HIS2_9PEZI|nr:putative annexin anxc4 [Erysiphe neolycopersici]